MDTNGIANYYDRVKKAVGSLPLIQIGKAADMLKNAYNFHERVWIVGNGGSAATVMHFANDLQKMCHIDAISIPSNIATVLAYGNDDGWDKMFSSILEAAFHNGDVLVAISCSGASMNVVNAALRARQMGGKLIVFTGQVTEKNVLSKLPCILIPVEDEDIKVQEDVHLIVCHSIAGAISK